MAVEDPVHGYGAGEQHRAELVAVDGLGDRGAGVPAQVGDLLDRHAAVRQQGHEAVPQLPGRPLGGVQADLFDMYARSLERVWEVSYPLDGPPSANGTPSPRTTDSLDQSTGVA